VELEHPGRLGQVGAVRQQADHDCPLRG
jgi:hypothetical protein